MYNKSVYLMEQQIGDRMERSYLNKLRNKIFKYYEDLESKTFFEQDYDEYVPIGGSGSFSQRSYRREVPQPILSGAPIQRKQPEKLPSRTYPQYINRNDIPSI